MFELSKSMRERFEDLTDQKEETSTREIIAMKVKSPRCDVLFVLFFVTCAVTIVHW